MAETYLLVANQTIKTNPNDIEVEVFETQTINRDRISLKSIDSQIQGHQDAIAKLQVRRTEVEKVIATYKP